MSNKLMFCSVLLNAYLAHQKPAIVFYRYRGGAVFLVCFVVAYIHLSETGPYRQVGQYWFTYYQPIRVHNQHTSI